MNMIWHDDSCFTAHSKYSKQQNWKFYFKVNDVNIFSYLKIYIASFSWWNFPRLKKVAVSYNEESVLDAENTALPH